MGKRLLFQFGDVHNTLIEVIGQIQRHLVRRTPDTKARQSQSEDQSDDFILAVQPLTCPQVLLRIQNSLATEEPITKARNLESTKKSYRDYSFVFSPFRVFVVRGCFCLKSVRTLFFLFTLFRLSSIDFPRFL